MSANEQKPNRDPGDVFPWRSIGLAAVRNAAELGWRGWVDTMPPGPATVHVIGNILVANPGIEGVLRKAYPQGINPFNLILDLYLFQGTGQAPQVITELQVEYKHTLLRGEQQPTSVSIRMDGDIIATIDPLEIVS